MEKLEPKYRKQLNDEQLTILSLLFRFRFGTRQLVSEYFSKTNPGMDVFRRLKVLEDRGFISKRHEPEYRLLHKPAAYYLSPDGARALQAHWDDVGKEQTISIKTLYKEKTVTEQFVGHCLDIFQVHNQLRGTYGNKLRFFAKSQLAGYDYFPEKLPDAYIRFRTNGEDRDFFLDIYHDDQPFFTAVRRIKSYFEYREEGDWAVTDSDFPVILAVCDSEKLLKRVRKSMLQGLKESWNEDVVFALTTKERLASGRKVIWQEPDDDEDDELLALKDIS